MKFIITRASNQYTTKDKTPCEEATKEKIKLTFFDKIWAKSIKEARKENWYKSWRRRGKNHREKGGYIICDVATVFTGYTIEMKSLPVMLQFQEKYGDIIIKESGYKEISLEVVIYDDYIE